MMELGSLAEARTTSLSTRSTLRDIVSYRTRVKTPLPVRDYTHIHTYMVTSLQSSEEWMLLNYRLDNAWEALCFLGELSYAGSAAPDLFGVCVLKSSSSSVRA